MGVVLDTGALIALERGDRGAWVRLSAAHRNHDPVLTSCAALAQAWRGGPRQALLGRALAGVAEVALAPEHARSVGVLLAASGTADVVDAHVALLAGRDDVVLTSDPGDIGRLLAARRVPCTVVAV